LTARRDGRRHYLQRLFDRTDVLPNITNTRLRLGFGGKSERTMLLLTTNGEWHRLAAMLALCCVLLVVPPRCEAQVNLVPNPSFEEIDSCPQWPVLANFSPDARPTYWYSCNDTPEYFTACVDTLTGVPSNFFTYQSAFAGNAYIGMYTYTTLAEFREMVGVQLISPLVVGQTYYASFYANAAFGGERHWPMRATDNIGLLFTMAPNEWVYPMDSYPLLRNYAHVHSTQVISDTLGWTLVSGSFVADSAYGYMIIGNHYGDALTMIEVLDPDTMLGH